MAYYLNDDMVLSQTCFVIIAQCRQIYYRSLPWKFALERKKWQKIN